ncbi:hypothetical protein GOQ04_23005 [Emticicia sp. ODNR4P]|nr:hypothetical protein [Emticicia sp. ODNR4P]
MAKTSALKQHNVPTTNFVVNLDKIDVKSLEKRYQLYTIEVPESFKFLQDKNKFAKLHNTYKEQLDFPYYFYSFAKPKASIFILVDKCENKENSISLNFDFLKGEIINAKERDISDICTEKDLHILVKLCLSSWYHKAHRTCQGDYFYIHSKDDKQKLTALLVKIQERKGEFEIVSEAKYLAQIDSNFNTRYLHNYNYFEQVQGTRYLRQLKRSEVSERIQNKNSLNTMFKEASPQDAKNLNFKPQRPSIKWYDSNKTNVNAFQGCRSELLRSFLNNLVTYINNALGEGVAEKQSHFMTEVVPIEQMGKQSKKVGSVKGYGFNEKTGEGTGLFLKLLGQIGVLDLRQKDVNNPNQNNFQDYVNLLNEYYGKLYGVSFIDVHREEIELSAKPILALQDVEKKAFEENGLLLGYDDQKPILYQEFAKKIPMQTLNINLNKIDDFNSIDAYFDYDIFKLGDFKHRLDVCLNELLLKKYIIDRMPIYDELKLNNSLPCLFKIKSLRKDFAYMYQNIFMYVDESFKLKFLNLDNPTEREERNLFLQNWNIDWFTFEKNFAERNFTQNENGQNKVYTVNGNIFDKHTETLKKTHLVFAKGTVLAIEETEERVLFDTDATQLSESQRIVQSKTALEGIYFSETENIYTVGEKSMGMSMDKSIKLRRLYYYLKSSDFKINDLLQTLSVQFVRNKQYTVYPYFFDLLNLYRNDIQ